MIGDVRCSEFVVRGRTSRGVVAVARGCGVGGHVGVIARAAATHQAQHDRVGILDAQRVAVSGRAAALEFDGETRLEAGNALVDDT